jgi:ABC-type ATPase with predicted acetyltransferase domain
MTPVKLTLEEVFRTEGLPEFTFVPPPNYNEILLDVRHSHKPVILEGQSGTGKTSCVRHILGELDPAKKPEYLTARDPIHVRTIEKVVSGNSPGSYVIDDFHRLPIDLQVQVARGTSAGDP